MGQGERGDVVFVWGACGEGACGKVERGLSGASGGAGVGDGGCAVGEFLCGLCWVGVGGGGRRGEVVGDEERANACF